MAFIDERTTWFNLPSQIDQLKAIVAELEGETGEAVTSVNGEPGPDVVLGASDVGADPEGAAALAEANAAQYTDDTVANLNLGTAAQADTGDFATAAQGALADSATQPGDLGNIATITVPTTDPGVAGEVWLDGGVLKASQVA